MEDFGMFWMGTELFGVLGEKMWHRTQEETTLQPSALPAVFLGAWRTGSLDGFQNVLVRLLWL